MNHFNRYIFVLITFFIFALGACTPSIPTDPAVSTELPPTPEPTATQPPQLSREAKAYLETVMEQLRSKWLEQRAGSSVELVEDRSTGEWQLRVENGEGEMETAVTFLGDQAYFRVDGQNYVIPHDFVTVDTKTVHNLSIANDVDIFGTRSMIQGEEDRPRFYWQDYRGEWVRNEILTSPGGKIIYNPSEMFEGLFTINPENEQELYENMLFTIYATNGYSESPAYRNMTFEEFLLKAQEGPMNDVRIPIAHPDKSWSPSNATYSVPMELVDLSKVLIYVSHPTKLTLNTYNYRRPGNKINTFGGRVFIALVQTEKQPLLSFIFGPDDMKESSEYNLFSVLDTHQDSHNVMAVNQMINIWNYIWHWTYEEWENGAGGSFVNDERAIRVTASSAWWYIEDSLLLTSPELFILAP